MQNSVFPALSSSTKRFLLSTSALSIALIGSPAMAQTVSSPANEQTSPPKSGLPDTDPATAPQTTELDETTTEDIVVRGIRAALESTTLASFPRGQNAVTNALGHDLRCQPESE